MEFGRRTANRAHASIFKLFVAFSFSLALSLTSMVSSLPAAHAGPDVIKGTGTFFDINVTILSIQMVGSNEVITDAGTGKVTGTLKGTYTFTATITVQPTGVASYSAIDVCKCTVDGNTGVLQFTETGTGNQITGVFQSHAVITNASGDLKGSTGTAILQGLQNPVTGLTSGTYSIPITLP